MQRDPLGYVDGMSAYSYCKSNPLMHTDATGLTSVMDVLDEFFKVIPLGKSKLWIMNSGDPYTSIVKDWAPVITEVEKIKTLIAENETYWKIYKNTGLDPSWAPNKKRQFHKAEGYSAFVSNPFGTDPLSNQGNLLPHILLDLFGYSVIPLAPVAWEVSDSLAEYNKPLHTSVIGSFRIGATVDNVNLSGNTCSATINIWMYNEMSKKSFGKYAKYFPLSSMKTQYMWWNWKETFSFRGDEVLP